MIQDLSKKWMHGKTANEIAAIKKEAQRSQKDPSEVVKGKEWKKHLPPAVPQKQFFEVKVESLLPSTLTYRVLAESPEQAADLIKNMQPIGVKYRLIGRKDVKATVYNPGGSLIRFIKNLTNILR